MSEGPPPLPADPVLPRGQFWACLLAPPVFTAAALAAIILAQLSKRPSSDMAWLPPVAGILAFAVFLVCLVRFCVLISRRHGSQKMVLLALVYVAGQASVAFALFFGACVMSISA